MSISNTLRNFMTQHRYAEPVRYRDVYPDRVGLAFTRYGLPGFDQPKHWWAWAISWSIRWFESRHVSPLTLADTSHVGYAFHMSDGSRQYHSGRFSGWQIEPWCSLVEQAECPGGWVEVYWLPHVSREDVAKIYVPSFIWDRMNMPYDWDNILHQALANSLIGKALHIGITTTAAAVQCAEGVFRLGWQVIPQYFPSDYADKPDCYTPQILLDRVRYLGLKPEGV